MTTEQLQRTIRAVPFRPFVILPFGEGLPTPPSARPKVSVLRSARV